MKDRVYIYEKDRSSLEFLDDFFKGHQEYKASYFNNLNSLRKNLRDSPPGLLLAGSPDCLERLKPGDYSCPIIAIVSTEMTKGITSAIKNNIEHYIYPPYQKHDLDFKLKTIIRKSKYLESLCQEKDDLSAIADLTYMLSTTLDPEEVLYLIVKKLSDLISVSRCSILSVGFNDSSSAEVVSTFEAPSIKNLKLDLKKYPEIKKALRTRKAVVVKDAINDPLMASVRKIITPLGIKSIVVVPIIFRSEVIGTLFLRTSSKGQVFTDREVKLCQGIANASANALNNAFMFEEIRSERAELEKLAITDFLTGVYNIRYLYHRLDEEFSRAQRYNSPLSCIMFDIDHFKRINDNYGHRMGDMILREFASLVKTQTRKSDVFARYGGEEFILILPFSDSEAALAEGKRIGRVVKKHRFKALKSNTRITVSLGISSYPNKKIKSKDDLINLADDALIRAKDSGRDRLVVGK